VRLGAENAAKRPNFAQFEVNDSFVGLDVFGL
jgi:hypothetical protein